MALVSAEWSESRIYVRGGAVLFELQGVLILQNSEPAYIRGISMMVTADERSFGGKGLVRSPVLNVPKGANFRIAIDLLLCRPVSEGYDPANVTLDGVVFSDLRFYGPDTLKSRQWLIAREMNTYPVRQRLNSILQHLGAPALRREMLTLLRREVTPSTEDLRLATIYRNQGMAALIEELAGF